MRDLADNVIIICSIENFDPMGIHTGDSITVAPAQTLTDREYQHLRDLSIKIIRRVGVETGGSNVQFAINPENGDVIVIELNPRVSRSSALASKATGFPIAKIAAQLAVGLTLDQIQNDITRVTTACFEPALDYVIVKIPRWNFEKFGDVDRTLGSAMRAVGEVMGIGRTFQEALLKAIGSLEGGWPDVTEWTDQRIREAMAIATPDRLSALFEALRRGWDVSQVHSITGIDRWFLGELTELVAAEEALSGRFIGHVSREELRRVKRMGLHRRRPREAARLPRGSRRRAPQEGRDRRGLQAGRHLRGRVRVAHAVPVQHLRRRGRSRRVDERPGDHPRNRPEPHRSGDRVRLLLLPRRVRRARNWA